VAEAMLQQTRVETVLPYYARWLEAFPDASSLAAAPLDAVLAQWQGLGYYRRARNLHAGAHRISEPEPSLNRLGAEERSRLNPHADRRRLVHRMVGTRQ
jgi:A/G-specific adenine glycosylase